MGIRVTDLNPDNDIGANCLLIEIGPYRLLVDSGLHPEKLGNEAMPDFSQIEPGSIDFIIVTHCHLDHIGSLPYLSRYQPQAQVLMSVPSAMLIKRMLHNSFRVMLRQRDEHDVPEYPLFTKSDVDQLGKRICEIPYHKTVSVGSCEDALRLTFYPAGHIVGAVGFRLECAGQSLFMTGDVSFLPQETLPGAHFPLCAPDLLITETTRGANARKCSREKELERLLDTLNQTINKKGSCLIPVFALGRMQEMVAVLSRWRKEGRLKKCSVYCSGLGMDLMDYFEQIAKETQATSFRKKQAVQLGVKPLPKNKGSLIPSISKAPAIYLVSSGMLVERTPSYGVASQLLGSSKNTICFVGYCDPSTPGGVLQATAPGQSFYFDVFDKEIPVSAKVHRFDLSGHADREELLDYAVQCKPKSVMLTHGGPEAKAWFEDQFNQVGIKVQEAG